MPAPRKLTVESIVDTALDLLREGGLAAVTQRAVALRLGVEAASLYRHVASKQRLLALVALRLYREQIDRVGVQPNWQAWLTSFGWTLWQTERDIPECAHLVLTTPFTGQDYATMSQWAADPLLAYGINRAAALEMQLSLQSMVLGMSGLCNGPNAALIRDIIPVERLIEDAIQALIGGWEKRIQAQDPSTG